jgi:hypothetical protein
VLLSSFKLEQMVEAEGATWLDRQLLADRPEPLRQTDFGRQAEDAIARRRRWLLSQGLATEQGDRTVYARNLLHELRRREVGTAARRLAKEVGKPFAELLDGERLEGVYRGPLRLASGKFAVIEKSRAFALVPWRPELERVRGRAVSGIVRGTTISWSFGQKRGLGIV